MESSSAVISTIHMTSFFGLVVTSLSTPAFCRRNSWPLCIQNPTDVLVRRGRSQGCEVGLLVFTEFCAVSPAEEQTWLSIGKGRTLRWHDICPSRKWMVIILLTQWEACVGKWYCRLRKKSRKAVRWGWNWRMVVAIFWGRGYGNSNTPVLGESRQRGWCSEEFDFEGCGIRLPSRRKQEKLSPR